MDHAGVGSRVWTRVDQGWDREDPGGFISKSYRGPGQSRDHASRSQGRLNYNHGLQSARVGLCLGWVVSRMTIDRLHSANCRRR